MSVSAVFRQCLRIRRSISAVSSRSPDHQLAALFRRPCPLPREVNLLIPQLRENIPILRAQPAEKKANPLISAFHAFASLNSKSGVILVDDCVQAMKYRDNSVNNVRLRVLSSFALAERARIAFDALPRRSTSDYTLLLRSFSESDNDAGVVGVLELMKVNNIPADKFFILTMCKFINHSRSKRVAAYLEPLIQQSKLALDSGVRSALVNSFSKVQLAGEADRWFQKLPRSEQTIALWTALIQAHAFDVKHYPRGVVLIDDLLSNDSIRVDAMTILVILRVASLNGNLELGERAVSLATRIGCSNDVRILGVQIDMYGKCGKPDLALVTFESTLKTQQHGLFIWNSLLLALSSHASHYSKVSDYFARMIESGMIGDAITVQAVVRAAIALGDTELGKSAWQKAIEWGCESDVRLKNSMIDMFGKAGDTESARKVFETISDQDRTAVSWAVLINALCTSRNTALGAAHLFDQLLLTRLVPDSALILALIRAASVAQKSGFGERVWTLAVHHNLSASIQIMNAMIDMYGKCGKPQKALAFFNQILTAKLDAISWNCLLTVFAVDALHAVQIPTLFQRMMLSGVQPTVVTVLTLLRAASVSSNTNLATKAMDIANKIGCSDHEWVIVSLIDAYGRSGELDKARAVFDSITVPSPEAYSAMISSYGVNRCHNEALLLFRNAEQHHVSISASMAISILQALSHSFSPVEARALFKSFPSGIQRDSRVIVPFIDCLCRMGLLDEAERMAKLVPNDEIALVSILGACRPVTDIPRAERMFAAITSLNLYCSPAYVILSNIYANAKMWDKRDEIMQRMTDLKLERTPGISTALVNGESVNFYANHKDHLDIVAIQSMMRTIEAKIRDANHVPDLSFVTRPYKTDQEAARVLCRHSERYAIAFSLLKLEEWEPIRIVTNLRVCGDCHETIRLISKLFDRTILLRDASVYHRFQDGACNCGGHY